MSAKPRLVPTMSLEVGDWLTGWDGEIVDIRETPRRRYITVRRDDGRTFTEYQDNRTRIVKGRV